MSQIEFAAAGGVLKNAQSNYERDKRMPDVQYLINIIGLGADINYLLTGIRPTETERRLFNVIQQLTNEQQIQLGHFLNSLVVK